MRILLIEDDAHVAAFIRKGLSEEGHLVQVETDGSSGLAQACAEEFDAIILDRMLPHLDGLSILNALRGMGDQTPLLVLSALGDTDERVRGLRAGADDYLPKPFSLSELAARIEVIGKRSRGPTTEAGIAAVLSIGDLDIDLPGRTVHRAGQRIDLTDREFRILDFLARNAGRVVTRSMLLERVWEYHFDPQTNIIDQHVSRLRQKLDRGFSTSLIETVRGSGYRLRRVP